MPEIENLDQTLLDTIENAEDFSSAFADFERHLLEKHHVKVIGQTYHSMQPHLYETFEKLAAKHDYEYTPPPQYFITDVLKLVVDRFQSVKEIPFFYIFTPKPTEGDSCLVARGTGDQGVILKFDLAQNEAELVEFFYNYVSSDFRNLPPPIGLQPFKQAVVRVLINFSEPCISSCERYVWRAPLN